MGPRLAPLPLLLFAAAAIAADAAAPPRAKRPPPPPAYLEECTGCHAAYLPRMLPAASWQRLLGGLPTHFGVDASLDAATLAAIRPWLLDNAGDAQRFPVAPEQDRITRAQWFTRQHHGIKPATWQRPAIGSKSNCGACHGQADQGKYGEHDVHIPK